MIGQVFGKLTVVERLGSKSSNVIWKCMCECGNEHKSYGHNLRNGNTKSCGCYRKEKATKHGHNIKGNITGEYQSWKGMKKRCYLTTEKEYRDYGARGIIVCERWRDSFENFLEDMGHKPDRSWSIERIDNNGNYEPSNCKWATQTEQVRNQRIRSDNTTGYKGVAFLKTRQKYRAYIKPFTDKPTIVLGEFKHKLDAVMARIEAEVKYNFEKVQEVTHAI